MKACLNNPEVTRRVLDEEGWLHTGDIGYEDADRYIYVIDRANDLVEFRGMRRTRRGHGTVEGHSPERRRQVVDTSARGWLLRRIRTENQPSTPDDSNLLDPDPKGT
jgi:hypothetical protein